MIPSPVPSSTAGWQPIETAPKDGTRIILFYRQHERIVCGAWDADRYAKRPRPYWRSDVEWIFGTRDAREFPPTHWLPLPAVPSSTAQT